MLCPPCRESENRDADRVGFTKHSREDRRGGGLAGSTINNDRKASVRQDWRKRYQELGTNTACDPQQRRAFGKPADREPASRSLQRNGDGEKDCKPPQRFCPESLREGTRAPAPDGRQPKQRQVKSREENGQPRLSRLPMLRLKKVIECEKSEGRIQDGQDDRGQFVPRRGGQIDAVRLVEKTRRGARAEQEEGSKQRRRLSAQSVAPSKR